MSKYLWIFGFLFFGGLAAFALFITGDFKKSERKSYEPSPLTFVIDWEIVKPFNLQIFYQRNKDETFNAEATIWKLVTPKDKHVEIVLPVERIYNFRLSFRSSPEKIIIKNIEIKGDVYLNFNHWNDYRYVNMEKTKVNDDGYLEIYSTHIDPYMVFLYPFVLDEKKQGVE